MGEFGYSKDSLRQLVGLAGQFLGTTDTQVQTNKTISTTDNLITAASQAAGDILVNNATKFVRRAIGAAEKPLKVNSGATDVEYDTLKVAGGGTGLTTATGVIIGTGTTAMTVKANPSGAFLGDSDTQNVQGKKTFFDSALGYRNAANTATLTVRSPNITTDGDFIFNGPYTYHIFIDAADSNKIKARYGIGEYIRFSDASNPATVLQACINALPTSGGIIFFKQGQYTTATKVTIPDTTEGVTLVFENPYTNWTYTGTDAAIEVGSSSSQTIAFSIMNGKIEATSLTGTPVCLRLINCNHARLYSPYIFGRTGGTATGIELDGGANFNGDIQIFAPYISNVFKGIRTTNGAANAVGIYGGFIGGNAGPIAGSYGIDKEAGDTWRTVNVDIENFETALRERTLTTPNGSSWFDMRVENCTNYVTTATSNNIFSGSTTTTIVTDTGTNNDYISPSIETYNRAKIWAPSTFKKDQNLLLTLYRPNNTINTAFSELNFDLNNASSAQFNAGSIRANVTTNTAGAETTNLIFYIRIAGVEKSCLAITNNGTLLCGGPNRRMVLSETGLTTFRTLTMPDADILAAGQNYANTFTALQTFNGGIIRKDLAITNADSPYTALSTTEIIRADATSGAITINLPTAVGIAGKEYHIFRTDILSSTNLITIDASSTQTIDGNLTYILYPGEYVKIESDGANWQVLGRPTPTTYGYYFSKNSTNNRRYIANNCSALTTSTTLPATDTLFALPIVISRTTKFDTISYRITTVASAGGVASAGIYRDNGNMYPGALIFDTGSLDATSGGGAAPRTVDTTITAGVQVFQPGLYWLAWQCRVAAPQIRVLASQFNGWNILEWDSLATTNTAYGYSVTNASNSLPDPYTAAATVLSTTPSASIPIPAIALRPI